MRVGIYINSVADQFLLAIDDFSVTTVACPTPPTVTSTPAASALPYTVGTAITSITMSATPTATYTYSITAGALPAGVTMTTAGVISGTPTTAAASGTFTVTATNTTNGACTGIKPFTFSVACPTLTVDSTPTPTALTLVVNTAMSNITMSTLGATGTFVYAITAGALPTGVTMSAGVISGTPSVLTASGTFTVTSTYGTNCTATKVFTYSVVSCPVNFTPATGATLTAGTLNVAYPATTISQSGISGTVTFSATGLPTPMVISSGGIITGTPTVGGTFTVVVSATNTPVTCAASATYTLVIACPVATLTIPAAANNGNVGIAYSATVTVPSGFTATGFTATGLPTGFSISSAGVIMGTATAASSGLVSITATAANGCTATGSYTLAITCPAITFIPVAGTLAAGTVGVAYTASVTPSIGTVTATGLPAGVTMTTAGAISGAPTAAGSFTVVVSAVVGTCPPVTSNYTIVVACPTITFTPATGALAGGSIGTPYTASVSASPIGTTLTATGLPAGLTMTSAGAISGTPTGSPATASVVVTATFGTCPVVTSNYTIVIACPTITLTPATGALAGGSIGSAYTASISVSPSGTTLAATGLPAGLTMTSAGAISGTPTGSPATANVVVTATFGTCPTATSNYTIVIGATLCTTVNITQTTLPNGTVGSIYAPIQLTATGGSSNTVFTFTPANAFATTGLSMSSTGLISGTPTLSTSVTVLITATNGTPCSGTRSLTLVTVPNPATAINGTLSSEVKVYPNPSKADFNVDFANLNLGKVAIRVYDVQGKQVFTTSTSDNTTVISLEKFAKGMYLLEIESQKGRILKRIVKE